MIPKIIHYVWVGNKPKPELILKCIESWKKFCPDFEIMEWDNDKVLKFENLYVKQAFEHKKWAFVSDYVRLYALKNYGGLYFDTDLEVTHSLNKFLKLKFFSGFEVYCGIPSPITSACMGAEKENKIICDLFNEYKELSFFKDGYFDETPNTARITNYFKKEFGVKKPYTPDKELVLTDGCVIYPSHYFCVPQENKVNYTIHHFDGSWLSAYMRKNMFNIGKYSFVRFRKRKNKKEENLPIMDNEKILFSFKFLRYTICLIKKGI